MSGARKAIGIDKVTLCLCSRIYAQHSETLGAVSCDHSALASSLPTEILTMNTCNAYRPAYRFVSRLSANGSRG